MAIYDLIEKSENATLPNSGGSGYKHNPLVYPKLILEGGTPENPNPSLITFLTDWLRGIKLNVHFNKETRSMDLCDIFNGNSSCAVCTKAAEWAKANKSKGKAAGMNPFGTSQFRVFLIYDHSKVGKKVLNDDGTLKYEEEPIRVYEQRPGEGMENFVVLEDANGDKYDYYDDLGEGSTPRFDLQPDRLTDCELMYEGSGDRIWSVAKIVKNERTSYRTPVSITAKQAQKILGSEAALRVPKNVREHFNQKNLTDLLPFLMAHYSNVDKSPEGWDFKDPVEGQKLQTVAPTTANSVL